jgi:hypothetical protein
MRARSDKRKPDVNPVSLYRRLDRSATVDPAARRNNPHDRCDGMVPRAQAAPHALAIGAHRAGRGSRWRAGLAVI